MKKRENKCKRGSTTVPLISFGKIKKEINESPLDRGPARLIAEKMRNFKGERSPEGKPAGTAFS